MKKQNKRGVEWISTVLYVLMSMTIIGILMAALGPKISEMKDNLIISQTIDSLNIFDETVSNVKIGEGTRLRYILQLKKGSFIIDSPNDRIIWTSASNYMYSEPGKTVAVGNINARTEKYGSIYNVTLELKYPYNITFNGDKQKILNPASLPYNVWVTNMGKQSDNNLRIDLSVE